MRISHINNYKNNSYSPSFGVNLQSKKLQFKNDDFFIKLRGFGTNSDWAIVIIETADRAVQLIRKNLDFESVLKFITFGVKKANQFSKDLEKRAHTGNLRVERDGWENPSTARWTDLITRYSTSKNNRYNSYADRFDYVLKHPLKNPYINIELTRPTHDVDFGKFLNHGSSKYIGYAFGYMNKIYEKLHANYILKEVKQENLTDVNNSVAEIRWLLAHVTPWERGSDAISNTFIRSIYKAIGIKTYPLKRGVSLDLEAYCTNLEDYIKNFPKYFQHEPKIID